MGHVSVIIATHGSPRWAELAIRHAAPTALTQGCQVIIEHGPSLADARNHAAASATGEWLVFLDADDRLSPGYARSVLDGSGDLRVSPLIELHDTTRRRVRLDRRHIEDCNPCHVGTAIRRELFFDCGGFPTFPCWEDWALFLRAHRRGATIEHLPSERPAYLATVRPSSTQRQRFDRDALHAEIRAWA